MALNIVAEIVAFVFQFAKPLAEKDALVWVYCFAGDDLYIKEVLRRRSAMANTEVTTITSKGCGR